MGGANAVSRFSRGSPGLFRGIFEGLYIAAPDARVLPRTSPSAVGITTRAGDSLKSFRDTALARRQPPTWAS